MKMSWAMRNVGYIRNRLYFSPKREKRPVLPYFRKCRPLLYESITGLDKSVRNG